MFGYNYNCYQPQYQPMVPNPVVSGIFNPYGANEIEALKKLNNNNNLWNITPADKLLDGCPHMDLQNNPTYSVVGPGTYNPDGDRNEVRVQCSLCGDTWNQINSETAPQDECKIVFDRAKDYVQTFKAANVSIKSPEIMKEAFGNTVTLLKRIPTAWSNNMNAIVGMEKVASFVPGGTIYGMDPSARVQNLMNPPTYYGPYGMPPMAQQPQMMYPQQQSQVNPLYMQQPVYPMAQQPQMMQPMQQVAQPVSYAPQAQQFALNPMGAAQPVQQPMQQVQPVAYQQVAQPVQPQPVQQVAQPAMVNTNMPNLRLVKAEDVIRANSAPEKAEVTTQFTK